MANLTEDSVWIDGIYQLEEDDVVQGGPAGIDNLQAKQLGARTRYLKGQVEQLASDALMVAAKASQAQAQAGTDDTKYMTPLRVAQAIAALASIASASETLAGKVELATIAETLAGIDTVRATHPAGVKAAINQAVAALAGTVPAALDTLSELATALGNDPNFATTVLNAVAQRVSINSKATLAQALSGTDDATWMTPLLVYQAIAALGVTTDFVYRTRGSFANVAQYNTSRTLTADDIGRAIAIGGTGGTMTLPSLAATRAGDTITMFCQGAPATIIPQGSDTIYGGNGVLASFQMRGTEYVELVNFNSSWVIVGGSWLSGALGVGQSQQNVAASRAVGTVYTNTTGRPILVKASFGLTSGNGLKLMVDGKDCGAISGNSAVVIYQTLIDIVPADKAYSISYFSGSSASQFMWTETRI